MSIIAQCHKTAAIFKQNNYFFSNVISKCKWLTLYMFGMSPGYLMPGRSRDHWLRVCLCVNLFSVLPVLCLRGEIKVWTKITNVNCFCSRNIFFFIFHFMKNQVIMKVSEVRVKEMVHDSHFKITFFCNIWFCWSVCTQELCWA